MGSDLKGKTNKASLALNKWEWPKNLENGEVDQMNDSDFHSIFNFELNLGDPISNCLGVELLRIKSCRQEFKKV